MLNYETILSNYDDKLTLMQWLKKVEAALENASATAFHVNKRGDATLTFSIDFADGSQIESEPIVLQQGESVVSCRIANGHLLLTLSNGDVLDAGVILSGNLNVSGNVTATGTIDAAKVTGNEIVETMTGYTFGRGHADFEFNYAGVVKNGNKLTFALFVKFKPSSDLGVNIPREVCTFGLPPSVASKIGISTIDGVGNICSVKVADAFYSLHSKQQCSIINYQWTNSLQFMLYPRDEPMLATREYLVRIEVTFLLSDNMAA